MKLLYCFGIFITFALQFYVPAEILIPPVLARVPERWETAVNLLLRTVLVIFTCKYNPINNKKENPPTVRLIIRSYSEHLLCRIARRKPGDRNKVLRYKSFYLFSDFFSPLILTLSSLVGLVTRCTCMQPVTIDCK